jgi:hypothetical protein
MLHYNPRHVSSINMPIFRRTNCIITASGIVTLCKRLYGAPDESMWECQLPETFTACTGTAFFYRYKQTRNTALHCTCCPYNYIFSAHFRGQELFGHPQYMLNLLRKLITLRMQSEVYKRSSLFCKFLKPHNTVNSTSACEQSVNLLRVVNVTAYRNRPYSVGFIIAFSEFFKANSDTVP